RPAIPTIALLLAVNTPLASSAVSPPGPPPVADADVGPTRAQVTATLRQANAAMDAGSFAEALEAYEAVRPAVPMTPQIPYNMGVAAYRLGDHDRAAELFQDALDLSGDPALRARSAYNLGTNAYARALQSPESGAAAAGDLDVARTELTEALDHYREAIAHDPDDLDARANAELTQRLISQLEAMNPPSESSPQDGESDGEESESQPPSDSNGAGEQSDPNSQSPPPDGSDSSESPPTPGASGESEESESQSAAPPEEEPEPESTESSESSESSETDPPPPSPGAETEPSASEAAGAEERDDADGERGGETMTRAEAERLLQAVRDRERQRQQEQARRAAARRPPVEKDW
ncbi:MAG: tetratricopeptide repeat protein, partial [Phycisphaerales bacterium]|nr:tetratricopeptide repeat protein [Phycisphaerales bacterium]